MKKNLILALAVMTGLCACNDKPKQNSEQTPSEGTAKTEVAAQESAEVPPILAPCVSGLPLFAPFNEGDIIDGGRILKQSPEKYTKFIMGDEVFDVTYKEEKNKDLEHDGSYLNQYFYKSKDLMKGQVYNYADPKAVENFLKTHGDMTVEGDIVPRDYWEGILRGESAGSESGEKPHFLSLWQERRIPIWHHADKAQRQIRHCRMGVGRRQQREHLHRHLRSGEGGRRIARLLVELRPRRIHGAEHCGCGQRRKRARHLCSAHEHRRDVLLLPDASGRQKDETNQFGRFLSDV